MLFALHVLLVRHACLLDLLVASRVLSAPSTLCLQGTCVVRLAEWHFNVNVNVKLRTASRRFKFT